MDSFDLSGKAAIFTGRNGGIGRGIAVINAPEAMTDDDWMSVIDTNLSGVFRFCRAAYPLLAQNGGKIINIEPRFCVSGWSLRARMNPHQHEQDHGP